MGEYLKECFNSIISQSLQNIEIICIDDCSTDNSARIINSFVIKDKRFKYIKLNKNSGSGISRNVGINNAKGEFIHFMDPDDFFYNETVLEKLYFAAINNNVKIVAGNMLLYDVLEQKKDIFISELHFNKSRLYHFEEDYPSCFGYQSFLFNTIFLRENNIYFPDYQRRQDPVFFLNVMINTNTFFGINEYVYVYRVFHKKVIWNQRKVIDALKSYVDNFKILISEKLFKHFLSEFNEFKFLVLANEDSFKKDIKVLPFYEKVIESINYEFFKELALKNLLLHEKEFLNDILEKLKLFKEKRIIIYGFGNIGIAIYESIKNEYIIDSIFDKVLLSLNVDRHIILDGLDRINGMENILILLTIYNEVIRKNEKDKLLSLGFKNII
jgi:glycosyltransferase involved in cell wall biosynthesis